MPVDRALRAIAGAVEQNRVVQWGGTRYDYDAQGRMVRKSTPSGPVVFAWNDEHQLVASGSVRGEWRYHYDALGRRIAKQRRDGARADAATWFAWGARYKTWGNLATEARDRDEEWTEGIGCRSQNLWFQGQYFDAETGLDLLPDLHPAECRVLSEKQNG